MTPSPFNAYQQTQRLALTPTAAEAGAFTKAASLLGKARDNVNDYDSYSAALNFNQLLWTVLQADLASGSNALPDELKRILLSLSLFVDRQTIMALSEPKAEHLDALIEIDMNLASGLRQQLSQASGDEPLH
ncbi:MAG: flagellar biosynthesis regulator FlaF [Rhodospirillales bacterium]|nr:flagellar biosynthesis regulator FlaF [Rhodospirillales bacterium]